MAQMRAQELKRSVLFVSNDGITAIIGPDGNIQDAAPPHQVYVLNGKVQPMAGMTPWMRNGMDPILFILLCLFIVATKREQTLKKVDIINQTNNNSTQTN